uniref:Bulb-type lectin domain-containing protein n=1 Tax=Oryza barthii TaxID=65489 RepID=A0A0D3EKD0_9ORYZ
MEILPILNRSTSAVLWTTQANITTNNTILGWNKITGLNHRIIFKKNLVDPAIGMYREELDPTGVNQGLLAPVNSTPYWSSGAWNGEYLSSIPEMASHNFF